jgi:hypothetical protein
VGQTQVAGWVTRSKSQSLEGKGAYGPRCGLFLCRVARRAPLLFHGGARCHRPRRRFYSRCSSSVCWSPTLLRPDSPHTRHGWVAGCHPSHAVVVNSRAGTSSPSATSGSVNGLGGLMLQLSSSGSCAGGLPQCHPLPTVGTHKTPILYANMSSKYIK